MPIILKKTDVAMIGLGASGGIAALELAKAGIEVVALEAGTRLTARDFPSDEIRQNIRVWMGRVKVNNEVPTGRLNSSQIATRPLGATGPMMNGVGGTSIHYATQSWRHNPYEYKVRSTNISRYGPSSIPSGSTVTDWPFDDRELEPYHDEIEYLLGVSGKAGNIRGKRDPRGNIFEAPRRREYPLPPLRSTGYAEMLAAAAKRLGWHPFPGPAAILSRTYKGQPACNYCGFCSGNGCHANAKGSTFLNAIPAAEKTGKLKVVTLARVTEINSDSNGRVTGVTYVKGNDQYFQPASVVLLGTYTYENTRLLLLSHSRSYPKGLSNNHGQVGKHFISHNQSGVNVFALYPHRLNRMTGTFAQGTGLDDFAGDNFDHTGLGFIGGGDMYAGSGLTPIASTRVNPPDVPRWGSAWKEWQKKYAQSWGSVYVQISGIPYEANYLDLDPTVRDPQGYPVVRVTFNLYQNEMNAIAYLREKVIQWFKEAGAIRTWTTPPVANPRSTHAFGGTRMGDDPETNVVNKWGFSHEAPNLGILGASTFPTSGGHNPTQQVQATALRTARYLRKNWKSIAE
jgi:gluconate 2-dehydrogenase alpha chain